jgi:hypothetical protein
MSERNNSLEDGMKTLPKCERCGASMLEEHVVVSGGLEKLKNISAWTCTACKRVEYGTMNGFTAGGSRASHLDMSA